MKTLKNINPILIVALTFFIILITQFIYFSLKDINQISILENQLETYRNKEIIMEDNIRILSKKANEVRTMLSLPEINLYENNLENDTQNNTNEYLPYYNAIDYIQNYSEKTKMENNLFLLLYSNTVKEYFKNNNIQIKKTGSASYNLFKLSNLYVSISAENIKTPQIYLSGFTGNAKYFSLKDIIDKEKDFLSYLDTELKVLNEHYSISNNLKKMFSNLNKNTDFLKFLKLQKLDINEIKTSSNKLFYTINNKDKSFSINVYLDINDLNFEIESKEFREYTDFYKYLHKFLLESDKRTEEIKVVDIAKLKVESVLTEDSFLAYLNQNNLIIDMRPREDNDYFYYDISEGNSTIIGSFAVQKIIGDIYLMDPEDIMISSLKYLDNSINMVNQIKAAVDIPDNLPQIIDNYSNKNSSTFVVIGSHENNADTIILVHADGLSGKVTLIAIPRDLYFQENKINDYYRTFGGEKFIEVLSDITGLSIEGYIAVDMYAFIDLINILGGIDITLEADLIDPTYMVRDNGEWSTLYYKKGTHHLNGIESLRIARSRHTSSDFGRTSRQQLVIKGIKDKMSSLDITDLGTILELFRTLGNYLDTNLSSMEMLSLFLKYKDSDLNRKQGLSTFNILYNTYTNIYNLEDKSKQFEEDFYRGYWILLPQKNDWNVIKWYIRSLIEEE